MGALTPPEGDPGGPRPGISTSLTRRRSQGVPRCWSRTWAAVGEAVARAGGFERFQESGGLMRPRRRDDRWRLGGHLGGRAGPRLLACGHVFFLGSLERAGVAWVPAAARNAAAASRRLVLLS